ncbi:MAG: hypothetical protein AW09_003941 [Candidatus Accumulibacter phosphatis]|uniref:Uncharacterized protein n=1 Tax=Candidatus Accumulibacter phosphatis TaxID=327160 RepID=A0A080LRQ0_9PROT|nr:MAG: hypothetical protein AW09_003941 [Candidatus Accumulibacter phosphatis]
MQGIDVDDVASGKNDRSLDNVFQFADIAWPGPALQGSLGGGGQAQARTTGAAAVCSQKMTRQGSDILTALPQGRDHQWKDVEPIEQILAKQAPRHAVGDVPIGGGNDTQIEAYRLAAPHPLDFTLLENAQQLGLQSQRHFGDFVEQQGSMLRLFKLAGLGVLSATESPLFITEKRGFEQTVRNRRTIDGDEWTLAARRVLVNIARHHFLAHTALATQQNRGVGLRDSPGQGKEIAGHRIDGDHPIVIGRFRQAIAQHMFEQCLWLEGLEQEVTSACPHGFDRAVDIGECRHQDHRQVRKAVADFLEQGNAIDRQHAHVADHQRHGIPDEQLQRLFAAASRHYRLPCQLKGIADRLTQCGVVFNHQNRQSLYHSFLFLSAFPLPPLRSATGSRIPSPLPVPN